MKGILAQLSSHQTMPPPSGEGLPYWTFWLLLFIILLLITFIFLRDKDLRRRLDLFLFGAKKTLIKIRLRARLKRESRKRNELINKLGQKVWQNDIMVPKGEKISQELSKLQKNIESLEEESFTIQSKISEMESSLDIFTRKHKAIVNGQLSEKKNPREKIVEAVDKEKALDKEITQKQKELEGIIRGINNRWQVLEDIGGNSNLPPQEKKAKVKHIQTEIERMNEQRNSADQKIKDLVNRRLKLEKERKIHQGKIEDLYKKLKKFEEGVKKRIREYQRNKKEWEKNKEKVQERMVHINKKKRPLFIRLGNKADETRINKSELSIFYSQIDKSNQRIDEIEQQIKEL